MPKSISDPVSWIKLILGNPEMRDHKCNAAFKKFDRNNNGVLEWEELVQVIEMVCKNFDIEVPEEDKLRVMFDNCDKNHDMVLAETEFRKFFVELLEYLLLDLQGQEAARKWQAEETMSTNQYDLTDQTFSREARKYGWIRPLLEDLTTQLKKEAMLGLCDSCKCRFNNSETTGQGQARWDLTMSRIRWILGIESLPICGKCLEPRFFYILPKDELYAFPRHVWIR
eukprot:gnl/TRDRNA2_/TRDRNA2_93397_c0_seq1.p1 gnl/TRDRNA2_/TRDRNA2_93397_c0~~gnl/TRDRNA2_/TRDRNA2_93397_c0_seq1.p1  ORF type:complete len:226 (-),score=23.18 gnl/TRDRNA2_/TRDRNA2_93397_c0_seq1:85-762(-)